MKTSNEYASILNRGIYENMPKTVIAAIAVSFAARILEAVPSSHASSIQSFILAEWGALHKNGIVPQKPLK